MSTDFSVAFTQDSSPDALFRLAETAVGNGAQSLLILAADGNDCQPREFDPWLKSMPVPVCGGVFPQLIHEQKNHEFGYLVVGIPATVQVHNIEGLSDPGADFAESVETRLAGHDLPASMLVLVDGMASRMGAFLDGIYDVFGSDPVYFGGGAGSLSFEPKPCLFSNEGMLRDHGQMTFLPMRFMLGVQHGWEKFAGPFVVTSVDRNVIKTLDFQPAFQFYREHVEADSGQLFSDDNFFDIAKGYPFGMERSAGSIVVRDPITHTGNHINCVGEVPGNAIVYLLKGRPERLIAAAEEAAQQVTPGEGPAILVDCISRVLFLENQFTSELQAVKRVLDKRPLFGMLTLGEIANGGDYCLEFYNKTMVLAATDG